MAKKYLTEATEMRRQIPKIECSEGFTHRDVTQEYNSCGFGVFRTFDGENTHTSVVSGEIWNRPASRRRDFYTLLSRVIGEYIEKAAGPSPRILAVGLGNGGVCADCVGVRAVDRVMRGESCFTFTPGVTAKTGIDTAAAARAICKLCEADLVLAIDSMAASSPERLFTMAEVSSGGITPGSGTDSPAGEISPATVGVPVITIGVPTVILSDLCTDSQPMYVTRHDSDRAADCYADLIGWAINSAVGKER